MGMSPLRAPARYPLRTIQPRDIPPPGTLGLDISPHMPCRRHENGHALRKGRTCPFLVPPAGFTARHPSRRRPGATLLVEEVPCAGEVHRDARGVGGERVLMTRALRWAEQIMLSESHGTGSVPEVQLSEFSLLTNAKGRNLEVELQRPRDGIGPI